MRYRLEALFEKVAKGRTWPRVVFIHTPKTGGNSINSYFKEYIGSKRSGRVVRYDDFREGGVDAFARRAQSAGYVMGHMPWEAFERCRDERTFAFTVLRDPYDRLRSLYYFIVNLPPDYPREDSVNWMQTLSLSEFLSSKDRRVRIQTDNYVARQFSGAFDNLPETREDRLRLAEAAIGNLMSMDLVGFNDDVDSVFARVTGIAGLPPPPRGRRLNVTADLTTSSSKRADAARPLDDEMRALAAPLVEADLIVYEHFLKLRDAEKQAD